MLTFLTTNYQKAPLTPVSNTAAWCFGFARGFVLFNFWLFFLYFGVNLVCPFVRFVSACRFTSEPCCMSRLRSAQSFFCLSASVRDVCIRPSISPSSRTYDGFILGGETQRVWGWSKRSRMTIFGSVDEGVCACRFPPSPPPPPRR